MESSGQGADARGRVAPFRPKSGRRGASFYVVGGPVAPDRACYVERGADLQLLAKLRAGEYCHVIAPRFSGKSSLVARVASRLRTDGVATAVVDLSQLGSRDGSTEAGRWYYGLAYRLVRDLRLKTDLQAWWQDKVPLSQAQRLGEFFREVVLGLTRGQVVLFLDEIDSVEQLDYAAELFSAVRACHDARATEPEYERLSFAIFGTSLPGGAAARSARTVSEIGRRIELADFRFDEARPLAQGLGLAPGDAERVLYRIHYWTGGHPYLTQKLCEAAARSSGRIDADDAVDRLVAARFFTRNAVMSEASLSQVRDVLDRAGKLAPPALKLYRRIRRGRKVRYDPASEIHELLKVCGLARVTSERRLVVRNRIYAEVFTTRWARDSLPTDWRRVRRVAVVVAALVGIPWFYAEVLPRPYESTLRLRSVNYDEAVAAWEGLRRIPGYAGRADRLLARVLARRSREATSWTEASFVDAELRRLPEQAVLADRLLVEFWERRAAQAEAREQRDDALLYRLEAYAAGPTADAGRLAELAGGDYERLEAVIRPGSRLERLAVSRTGSTVVTLTGGNVLETWDAATGLEDTAGGFQLLADEFVTVRRRLTFDADGVTAVPVVGLDLVHQRPADLVAFLVAPSGHRVPLPLGQARAGDGLLWFDEQAVGDLASFRGEPVRGTWSLEMEDTVAGETGLLVSWTLRLSRAREHSARDEPENPLLLPDPAATAAVDVVVSADGATVAALPRNAAARGRARAWRVADGSLVGSVPLRAASRQGVFAGPGVLVVSESGEEAGQPLAVSAWDLASGASLARFTTSGRLAAGPVVSPDGGFLGIAEAGGQLIQTWSLADGAETGRIAAAGEVAGLALGPGGRLAAVADRNYVVRVWRSPEQTLLGEFSHDGPVLQMMFDDTGRWLATLDGRNDIRVWSLDPPAERPVLLRRAEVPGEFGFGASGTRFALHAPDRRYEVWALPDAVPVGPVLRHGRSAEDGPPVAGVLPLVSGGRRLVTGAGAGTVRIWTVDENAAPAALPRLAAVTVLSPAADVLAAGLADGRVAIRALAPGQEPAPVAAGQPRHGGPVTAMAFSPDGSRLASVGSDGSVLLWDVATRQPAGTLFHHGSGRVWWTALSADGRLLVTAGELGAKTWDAVGGTPGVPLGVGRSVSALALEPSGLRAFTGTPLGEVEAWNVATGERLWNASLGGPVEVLAVSSDGRHLVAAGPGGQVKTWALFGTGASHNAELAGAVVAAGFSPDGSALVVQTREWVHRLGYGEDDRLVITSSRLLPAAVPAGAWRPADPAAEVIRIAGGSRPGELTTLSFTGSPAAPEGWVPDPGAWQRRLSLHLDSRGNPVAGPAPAVAGPPLPTSAGAAPDKPGDPEQP
ncbi:MAG: AAA-like domain-containing protein [Gammaproteobacteria bacterium]